MAVPKLAHIGDALQALDCLLMASPCEGFSMALVEALMAGVPVVSTVVGIAPELLAEYGELFVPIAIDKNPAALAAAVRRAIDRSNRANVERARAVVRWRYSAENMAAQWSNYLLTIAGW